MHNIKYEDILYVRFTTLLSIQSTLQSILPYHLLLLVIEMSTSTNGKAVAARGLTWEDPEVLHLLTLWAQPEIQSELESSVRNKAVYSKLARQLADEGGYPAREGEARVYRVALVVVWYNYKSTSVLNND